MALSPQTTCESILIEKRKGNHAENYIFGIKKKNNFVHYLTHQYQELGTMQSAAKGTRTSSNFT